MKGPDKGLMFQKNMGQALTRIGGLSSTGLQAQPTMSEPHARTRQPRARQRAQRESGHIATDGTSSRLASEVAGIRRSTRLANRSQVRFEETPEDTEEEESESSGYEGDQAKLISPDENFSLNIMIMHLKVICTILKIWVYEIAMRFNC